MHNVFRTVICFLAGSIIGCYQPYEEPGEVLDQVGDGGAGGSGGGEVDTSPPTSSSTGNNSHPPSEDDKGFDPCPEDTYQLWEIEEGISYEIRIEVFCEPIQDLNLGCPAP